jgi:Abnormal spindle-like microcephaly-assoc'd, ASPM-SPD-2-Hydin/Cep192 domain 4/HYDIN/CFA65/VesB-like, Ig-like domain
MKPSSSAISTRVGIVGLFLFLLVCAGLVAPAQGQTATIGVTTLSFSPTFVGNTSASMAVGVTNSGTVALTISSITTTAQFSQTNTCGSSLAAGGHCVITATFAPTALGAQTGTMTLTDNASDSPQTINLKGSGLAPAHASVASVTFAKQALNTTSAATVVTITNSETTALGISGISTTGDFAQTNTCPASMAGSSTCTASVTFKPTAAGTRTGALTVTTSVGYSFSVTLSGTGYVPVAISPTSLAFGSQATGTTSVAQKITVVNNQTTALSGLSVALSQANGSGFAQTNACGTTLAAGASCTDSVTFAPTTTGAKTGTVTINYTGGTAQAISLTGTGAAAVTISPTSLTFASQEVGVTSAAQTLTVTNSQSVAMTISSIAASAGFAETNTCGSALAAKGSCTISVTFVPTVAGAQTGTITISDNVAGSPQTVALSGTATASVTVTPNTLPAFGPQLINTTSPAKTITVKNTSGGRVTVTVSVTGSFAQNGGCSGRLSNNDTCTISVTFKPTTATALTGTLSISAGGVAQTVALSGTGASVAVGVSPASLAFGSQNINTSSAAKVLTLSNNQSTAAAIGITLPTGYSQTNTCTTSLAANTSCTISVVFAPTTAASANGNMTITAGSTTLTVPITGTGVAPISLTPSSVFSPIPMGATEAVNYIFRDNLTVNLGVTSITTTGPFTQTNNCTTLTPGAYCTIAVTFAPTTTGVLTGTLVVNDNYAATQQVSVNLQGTSLPPDAFSAASLAFGNGVVSSPSAAKTLTLSNSQSYPMSITGVTMTGDYSETDNCNGVVAAKGNCVFNVVFTASATGSRPGSIAVAVSPGINLTATLTGTGIQPPITALPMTVTFGPNANPYVSTPQTVTVHNATNGPFTISSISSSTNFSVQGTSCPVSPSTLGAGASCTVSVAFAPAAAVTTVGVQTGSLSIADNATGSPQVVALSGTATPQMTGITVSPNGVTLGLNGTQQFTAQATFASVAPMDVTNTAVWASVTPGVVGVNGTGLATVVTTPNPNVAVGVTASLEGVSGAGFVSTSNTAPVTCTTPTIDMKLLVINNSVANYADFPAIQQVLNYVGTPYQVVDASTGVLPALSDGACHGYYQGVIFAYGGDYYSFGGQNGATGLTYQQTLINYEITFKVRQLNWYDVPDTNFGMNNTGTQIPSTQTYTANFTPAAASVFFYANTATPLTITNAAVNLATAGTGGGTLTPLLQSGSNIISAIYNNGQGQTFLTQTFDSNASLTHDLVVAYGLLNWVSQGVFLGDYHVYASPQVDDFFIDDSEWTPDAPCLTNLATRDRTAPDASNLPVFRLNTADMTQLVSWQTSVQNDPSGLFKPFTLTLAMNGVGTVGNGDWTGLTAPIISSAASGGVATFMAQDFAGLPGQSVTITNTTNGGGVLNGTFTINAVSHNSSQVANQPGTATFTVNVTTNATIPTASENGAFDDSTTATVTAFDDLTANLQSYQGAFHWITHTYNHPSTLNGLCKSTPDNEPTCGDAANSGDPTDDIDLEILSNRWIAGDPNAQPSWMLDGDPSDVPVQLHFTDFNPSNAVTPGVTGLNDPNVPGYMYTDGIRFVVSDTSVIGQPNNGPNPSPNVGIVSAFNGVDTGIYEVPRYPNDIFYNAASWSDDQNEFVCIYSNYVPPNSPAGTQPAAVPPFNAYNASQILDFTSGIFVQNMLKGDMDPQMFHQPDLHFGNNYAALTAAGPTVKGQTGTPYPPVPIPGLTPSSVGSLISDTYNLTFTKYKALYNLPVLSPTLDQAAGLMQARNAYNLSGVTASLIGQFGSQTISITMPTGGPETTAVIPVTGLNTQGAETYGGQFISHIPVTAGAAPITYPAP